MGSPPRAWLRSADQAWRLDRAPDRSSRGAGIPLPDLPLFPLLLPGSDTELARISPACPWAPAAAAGLLQPLPHIRLLRARPRLPAERAERRVRHPYPWRGN